MPLIARRKSVCEAPEIDLTPNNFLLKRLFLPKNAKLQTFPFNSRGLNVAIAEKSIAPNRAYRCTANSIEVLSRFLFATIASLEIEFEGDKFRNSICRAIKARCASASTCFSCVTLTPPEVHALGLNLAAAKRLSADENTAKTLSF